MGHLTYTCSQSLASSSTGTMFTGCPHLPGEGSQGLLKLEELARGLRDSSSAFPDRQVPDRKAHQTASMIQWPLWGR